MASPFVAAGMAFIGIVIVAILNTSASQMQFSVTASIQNDKVKEDLKGTLKDGKLEIKNEWAKTSRIKEIRVVDDSGNVVVRQTIDEKINSFERLSVDDHIASAISHKVNPVP